MKVAVVGGGVVGLAVAHRLARDGCSVDLFERHTIGHERASSHGDVRMRVPAGFPTADYAMRGRAAEDAWRELERTTGRHLLTDVGCLFWGDGPDELGDALAAVGEPYETVSPADVQKFWGVKLSVPATWQPRAGYIEAAAAVDALALAATHANVTIHERVSVLLGGDDAVVVDGRRRSYDAVVVAAGAWSRSLVAQIGIELPVRSTVQSVAYFDVDEPLPGLIQYGASEPYACPVPGIGLKAAFHAPGPFSADDEPSPVDPEAVAGVVRWLTELLGRPYPLRATRACRYTWTADESFLIEEHGALLVVSACSGHGFQYAPDTAARVAARVEGSA